MSYQTALAIFLPLGLAIAAMGSAFGLGRAVSAAMEAMGRQPEAAGKIQLGMIIGCALIEALTIYLDLAAALVVALVAAIIPTRRAIKIRIADGLRRIG